jgi:putative salt-induced outer membrane protein YdiY
MKILLFLCLFINLCRAENSLVEMDNSMRLIGGELQLEDENMKLEVYGNPVSVPIKEVKYLQLNGEYRVVLHDDSVLVGNSPENPDPNDFLVIKNISGSHKISREQIKELRTMKSYQKTVPSIRNSWDKRIELGYQNQTGNVHQNKMNFFGKFEKSTDFDGIHITMQGTQGNDTNGKKDEAGAIKARTCLKYPNGRWYFLEGLAEYDKLLNVDLRTNLSIGTGWDIIKTKERLLLFSIGIGSDKLTRTDNTQRSELTGLAILDWKLPFIQTTSIEGNLNFYPEISDYDRLRADGRISLVHPLTDSSSLKLTAQPRYSTDVAAGTKKLDNSLWASYAYQF